MKEYLKHQIESKKYSDVMNIALQMIVDNLLLPMELKNRLQRHGCNVEDLKDESLMVVLDFIEVCLDDNHLTEEELNQIRILKLFLKINEGDFIRKGRQIEVSRILEHQLELMYCDNYIDKKESLQKVSLQEVFGLSYDEYLAFEIEAAEKAISRGARAIDLDALIALDNKNTI